MLEVNQITKEFIGVKALKGVSLKLPQNLVTAIIGENGAGKSTLMKILSGVYQDYGGTIFYNGQPVSFRNTKEAQEMGICIIHQELNLIPHLSIQENIFLGREPLTPFGILDEKEMRKESLELLKRLKMDVDPNTPVIELKVGEQQLVEIAKALSMDSQVIIMDEPTSAISDSEVKVLFDIIRDLKAEGKAIAYISHKLEELFIIAEKYVVLRDGEMIEAGDMSEMTQDMLIQKMVGRKIIIDKEKSGKKFTETLLSVNNICLKNPNRPEKNFLRNISFSLGKGEVLGIFGLMGAGRTELLETLFGMHGNRSEGEAFLEDKPLSLKSPMDSINAGMALVPEDRKHDGLVLGMDITQNVSLSVMGDMLTSGFLDETKEKNLADKYMHELNIKASSCRQQVEKLSGGNQQKVVLAKWLATKPKILMLDEPTRGIDINAKNEIYKLIKKLASEGLGLLVVSSELPEILAVSDRVIVLAEGKMTADITINEFTSEDEILKAAIIDSNVTT